MLRVSIRNFQKRILSGSPSRPCGPGNKSRKKSLSAASKDRKPLGVIRIVAPVCSCKSVAGADFDCPDISLMKACVVAAEDLSNLDSDSARNARKSVAMSLATEYRSAARLAMDFAQMRSNSLGIFSSIDRIGRGSRLRT